MRVSPIKPDWGWDGRDWPNREASRFVEAGGLRWHVQEQGGGPVLLLVHGTAAATHSWRDLFPLLARDFTVVAPDLPGHGFTQSPLTRELALPAMARACHALLEEMGRPPVLGVGHSAGAAILARMALDGLIAPDGLVSLNGAFLPFRGVSGHLFPAMAKLLFLNPFAPRFFAWQAGGGAVERLIEGTGSQIDDAGLTYYARLMRCSGHVAGALGMMANWDLEPLAESLPHLAAPLLLVVGETDRAVSPADALEVEALAPRAHIKRLKGLGHLAHEQAPELLADIIVTYARELGVLSETAAPL